MAIDVVKVPALPVAECRDIGRSIRLKTGDYDGVPLAYLAHAAYSIVCAVGVGGHSDAVGCDPDLSAITRELARRTWGIYFERR